MVRKDYVGLGYVGIKGIDIHEKHIYRARNNYWRVTIKYYRNFIIEVTETCNTAMEREFC